MNSLLEVLSRRDTTSAGPRHRKWLIRALAGLFVVAGTVVLQAGPAAAICEGDAPAPIGPNASMAGWLTVDPDMSKIPETAPDPWADPKIPFTDVYGYGAHWGTYDLGCGSDTLNEPGGVMFTKLGNLFFEFAKIPAVASSAVKGFVTGNPLDWMDSTLTQLNLDVDTKVWRLWFPLSVVALGAWFIWRARRADFAEATKVAGIALVLTTLSVFLLQYPSRANDLFDKAINTGVNAASTPFSAGRIDEQINRQILYPAWVKGELGSSTSATATTYGPGLYKATHYSWSDVKAIQSAGKETEKKQKEINKAKSDEFKKLAEQIKDADPAAYEHLTGRAGETRFGAAIFAGFFSWPAGLFFLFAMLMVALALLMTRGFVIGAPLVAMVAIHPKGWTAMQQLLGLFTAALFNAAKFTFAGALYSILTAALLNAPVHDLMKLFFLIVVTTAAFVLTKPFRALKTIIPGMDPNHSYLGGMVKRAISYATTRKATRDGVNDANRSRDDEQQRVSHEEESMDPIPEPQWDVDGGNGVENTPKPQWSQGQGQSQGKNVRYEQVFLDDEAPAAAPTMPALNPAPIKRDHAPARPGEYTQTSGGQVDGATSHGPFELPPATGTRRSDDGADSSAMAGGAGPDGPDTSPTGGAPTLNVPFRLGDEGDEPIYRPVDDTVTAAAESSDVPIAEKQLDDNGDEVYLIYRTSDDDAGRSES